MSGNKDARIFMRRYAGILYKVEAKQELLERLRSLSTSITSKTSDGCQSPTRQHAIKYDALDDARIVDEMLASDIDGYLNAIKVLDRIISRVRNPQYLRVLTLRYVKSYGWRRIANELQVSERHAQRLNSQALDVVQKILSDLSNKGER